MVKKKKQPADAVFIGEVAKTLNRRTDTVRRWTTIPGLLPKKLQPHWGVTSRNVPGRYWTPEQVDGLRKWMAKSNMRPGPMFTDPAKEEQHISNLRKPRWLNGFHIKSARHFAEQGMTRDFILDTILPRTQYKNRKSLENALLSVAESQGWEMPPKASRKLTPEQLAERQRLEKLLRKAESLTEKN